MNKWDDYFKIVRVENQDWTVEDTYNLVTVSDDKVVGSYKDYKYAKKQAKYKFKKILSKVEEILLG